MRKIASTTMLVSFIALASSGVMMMFADSFGFQVKLHPVHKIFGLIMVISGIIHAAYNFKAITKYLKNARVLIYTIVIAALMFLLYFAGFKKPMDEQKIQEIEEVMRK